LKQTINQSVIVACYELLCLQYNLPVKSASSDHHPSTRMIDVVLQYTWLHVGCTSFIPAYTDTIRSEGDPVFRCCSSPMGLPSSSIEACVPIPCGHMGPLVGIIWERGYDLQIHEWWCYLSVQLRPCKEPVQHTIYVRHVTRRVSFTS
jgi:hypothetical protein